MRRSLCWVRFCTACAIVDAWICAPSPALAPVAPRNLLRPLWLLRLSQRALREREEELGGGKTSIYAPYVNPIRPSHPSVLTSVSSSSYPCPTRSFDMNYGNIPRPLHPLNVNTSTYSSLHNAVTPQMSTFVPVNHRNPDSRMSMSPRPVELPDITIHFGSGRGTPGVSFSDIKKGKLNWMSDQLVPELQNLGQVSINLNISVRAVYRIDTFAEAEYASQWPGYGHLPGTYPLELFVNNRPVTRLHLAQQIVKAYERFLAVRASRDRVPCSSTHLAPHTERTPCDLRGRARRERHDVGDRPELYPHALRSAVTQQRAQARWGLPGRHPDRHGLASATCSASLSPLPRSHHTLDAARTRDGLCP